MNRFVCVLFPTLCVLSACGGGSSNTAEVVRYTREAVVIDGYVRDALVYVDLNENGKLDESEPWALTNSEGFASVNYDHQGELPKDLLEYPMIAQIIAGQSYDMGSESEFDRDFEFVAADQGKYLTPFTTVGRLLAGSDKSVAGVQRALEQVFAVNDSDLSSFAGDYVAESDSYYDFLIGLIMQELPQPDSSSLEKDWEDAINRISLVASVVREEIDELTPESIDWSGYQLTWGEDNQPELSVSNTPPFTGQIVLENSSPNTTQPITVSLPDISDVDGDDLSVTFQWRINGDLFAGITGDTLPAGLAKKGDEVQIIAVVSDGVDKSISDPVSVIIADAPTTVSVEDLVDEVSYGGAFEFTVSAVDPDEEVTLVEKAYGPSGMQVDSSGKVTWAPNELMMQNEEEYFFGLRTVPQGEVILERSVRVIDDSRAFPLVRSGIEVPGHNHSIWVADFSRDGTNEIVLTDSVRRIFTLKYDGESYVQNWMYPFVLPNEGAIQQILVHDLNKDGNQEIIAITEDGISVISGPNERATLLYSSINTSLIAAAIEDVNGNGKLEIAVLSGDRYGDAKLSVYQLDSWELLFSAVLAEGGHSVLIDNVDADDALEIIVSSGYVFDGSTGENEWYYPHGFGSKLAVGDVNNDGVAQILGSFGWTSPVLYDVPTKSVVWELDNSDICSLNVMRIDTDQQDKILVGNCQWGQITAYNAITGEPVQEAQWDSVKHGSISVTAGDANNDGQVQVLWGSGITSTGEDVLVVGEVNASEVSWYNQDPAQLDEFSAVGWANVSGDEQAVFVVPNTDSGYSGQRIVTMTEEGDLRLSEEIASNWDNSRHGAVVDYDDDGIPEIFLASAETYDGQFQVRQLDSFALEWSGGSASYEDDIGAIIAADVNDDGYEDAIYVNGSKVQIVDVFNQVSIWTSEPFNGFIRDIALLEIDNEAPDLVISAYNTISIWRKQGNGYEVIAETALECQRIVVGEALGNGEQEIYCSSRDFYSGSSSTITVLNSSLEIVRKLQLEGVVTDMLFEPAIHSESNLLVAVALSDDHFWAYATNSELWIVSPVTGDTVWRSPLLVSEVPSNSMYYLPTSHQNKRLTFATKAGMYLTH